MTLGSDFKMSAAYPTDHKRSKSASDNNLEFARIGTSYCQVKEYWTSQNSKSLRKSHGVEDHPSNVNSDDSAHRASLENDIKKLQMHLCQEKSLQLMLERAIGRASSSLSPGHRYSTVQTKDLIAEIELLEEEIANREQHVLLLYRSIFDQCFSASSSRPSSGMSSPAHIKYVSRKHPNIISSTFCSSKKFPLQPSQVLASIKESGKISVLTMCQSKHEMLLDRNISVPIECNASDLFKLPTGDKTFMAHTFKDYLYQCPSKLSEELVICMATVYCLVQRDTSVKPEKLRSPSLSGSSNKVVLSSQGAADSLEQSCGSTVEISSISSDKGHLPNPAYAVSNYRLLVEQLERVNVSALDCPAKLAFWINVYNSLVMHAHLAYGVSHGSSKRLTLFRKAAYNIGGHIITANSIEHSILHCRTPRLGRWFESMLSTALRKRSAEEKQLMSSNFCLLTSQPFVLFALCAGCSSDPTLRMYTAKSVMQELERARKDFLRENIVIKKSRKICLPKLLDRYAKEAGLNREELLAWLSINTETEVRDAIQKCSDRRARRAARMIEWLPFDSKFRYVFEKDLREKSCRE